MKRESIPVDAFSARIMPLLKDRWMLLTAGENAPGKFNMMTVGWAMIGVMWNKPVALAVVRPSRHTFKFMESAEDFTLCVFPESFRDKLVLCGSKSGRDIDKVKAAGFTVMPSSAVKSPCYAEAELVIECRKIYADDFKPEKFLSADIEGNYGGRDYHRVYIGEIAGIHGTAAYRK